MRFVHLLSIALISVAVLITNCQQVPSQNYAPLIDINNSIAVKLVQVQDELSQSKSNWTPVVFWHGMGDTAFGSINIDRLALMRMFPGVLVLSIQIGDSTIEDEVAGYFVNVNYQINKACKEILANEPIKKHGAFNAVGFSQGSQFLRGLIQRCPLAENGIKVKNFISLGGQHQGVFGLPNCEGNSFCDHIRYLLSNAVYERQIQEHVVQAQYWHDPLREEEYKSKNVFLADINNENFINLTYKRNLMQLDNLVLVGFENDGMVVPHESSMFGFYAPGATNRLIPLEQSSLYLEDRIGLRELKLSGRLRMISLPGRHLQYNMTWFRDEIASVYLNN